MRKVGVIVDADIDPFSRNLARAAADAAKFRAFLEALGKERVEVQVKIDRNSIRSVAKDVDSVGSSARRTEAEIDKLSGRVRLLADAFTILGPALVPLGALAIPAVAGLANQLGLAAAAGGTALLAFQGVGDAVTAMNKAAVEPTTENLLEVEAQLSRLSPQAAEFARGIGDMRQTLLATRDAAAEGLFPELTPALDDLDGLLGRIQPMLTDIGSATGAMLADGLESLNSERWQDFYDFLGREAGPTLQELGETTGDFAHGLANLWQAFQPLNRDFSGWLRDVASGFDGWSDGLAQTDGFNELMDYISDNGPQVADTLGALGGALLDIAVAAAPFGGPVLAGIEALANLISTIAESPAGPALVGLAGGLALVNRAMAVQSKLATAPVFANTRGSVERLRGSYAGLNSTLGALTATQMTAQQRAQTSAADHAAIAANADKARDSIRRFGGVIGSTAGPMAGLALATSDAGDKFGATALSFGLMGSAMGPWGAVAGAAVGVTMELAQANDGLEASITRANNALKTGSIRDVRREYKSLIDTMAEKEQGGSFWEETLGGGIATRAMEKLTGSTEKGARTIQKLNERMSDAAGVSSALGPLGKPFDSIAGSADAAAMSTQTFLDVSTRLGNYLAGESSLIAYEQAIDDLAASLKKNGNNFDFNTQKGRENGQAMINAAGTAMDYAKTLKGMDRIDFLRGVKRDLNDTAKDFPAAERMLNRINRQLERMGSGDWRTAIEIDGAAKAELSIGELSAALQEVDGTTATALIKANPASAGAAIGLITGQLGTLGGTTATPTLAADSGPAEAGVRRTRDQLSALNSERSVSRLDADGGPATARTNAVRNLLQQYGAMRPSSTLGAIDNASGTIGRVQGMINALPASRTTTLTTILKTVRTAVNLGASIGFGSAEGNFVPSVRAYAEGGLERPLAQRTYARTGDVADHHQPELAGPGPIRMWREPETKGEAYLPLANDYRRPRAKSIAEQVVDHFGGEVEWYARGGRRGGRDGGRDGGISKAERRERAAALQRGLRDFNPDPDDGVGALKREIREFQKALREAHRPWTKAMREQAKELTQATRKYTRLNRELDKATAYQTEVADRFTNDIFGNGVEGLQVQLEADAADASAMRKALREAADLGLNGQLYKALGASGDLNTAQQLATMSRAEIDALERQYAARTAATTALGATAAREVYGKSAAEFTRAIKTLDKQIARLPAAIERGATRGTAAGARAGGRAANKDRDRRVAMQVKVARR